MADALDLESSTERCVSSSLTSGSFALAKQSNRKWKIVKIKDSIAGY